MTLSLGLTLFEFVIDPALKLYSFSFCLVTTFFSGGRGFFHFSYEKGEIVLDLFFFNIINMEESS